MHVLTLDRAASVLDLSLRLLLPPQPTENSGPRDVSAVKECLVPRLDSNTKPTSSSRSSVACGVGKKCGSECAKSKGQSSQTKTAKFTAAHQHCTASSTLPTPPPPFFFFSRTFAQVSFLLFFYKVNQSQSTIAFMKTLFFRGGGGGVTL